MKITLADRPGAGPFRYDPWSRIRNEHIFFMWGPTASTHGSWVAATVRMEAGDNVLTQQEYNDIMENVKILCEARWGGG